MQAIQFIDTPEKLDQLCQKIEQEPWVALDTEFLREKTYYPKFCLLQIATLEWVACVDPLALPSLDQLFEVLYQQNIIKVLHACQQDIEIFYQLTGKVPEPIFDTQLAAPVMGLQDNPGYAMLVSSFLNVNLDKAHTRTDWSIRPLTEEQLQYAADDVIYLAKIYQIMLKKLSDLGRSDWLEDDFAKLKNTDLYDLPPENAWLKIRGKNKLTNKQLSVLQALSVWREQTVKQENKPRGWLMRDDLLLDIARLQPVSMSELFKIRNINGRTAKQYGHQLCELVKQARTQPPIKVQDSCKAPKKTQQQEAIVDLLAAIVRIRADQNSLNPSILATRKDLEMLLFEDSQCSLFHGWRYEMAGKELLQILEGENMLIVRNGEVFSELINQDRQ
jgi:ribonuclease D